MGYDVAIVGASLAGSTTATLLGRAGLRVALIERHRDPDAYKVLCTHYLQASATPTVRRLGLDREIEAVGGLPNNATIWTRWGWIVPPDGGPHGYNVRRRSLDPMLRRLAADTPGVELMTGQKVTGLLDDDRAVGGVRTSGIDGREHTVRARLVIGADGPHSTVAQRAGAKTQTKPNDRFAFFAYFTGVDLAFGDRSQMWLRDPDVAYTFPNDDVTVLACMPSKQKLAAFQRDREAALLAMHRELPDGPRLEDAERVSDVIGTTDYPLVSRPAVPRPGLALVGDAALTSDPLWGVGCGWALQTGEWLADAVTPALAGDERLSTGLRRYQRHRRALRGHQFLIADYATARPLNPLERLMFSAAAHDERLAARVEAFGARRTPARGLFAPTALARAAWITARRSSEPAEAADPAEAERV